MMNLGIKWSQKKILRILLFVLIIYIAFSIIIISAKLLPPLITSADIEHEENNFYTVVLKGRFPRKDISSKIIVDTLPLDDKDIKSWKKNKITFVIANVNQKVKVVQIKDRSGASNKKILLMHQGNKTQGYLDEDERSHIRSDRKPKLSIKAALKPYDLLDFTDVLDKRYSFILTTNTFSLVLPNHFARHSGKSNNELQLIFPDTLWFFRSDKLELTLKTINNSYDYTIELYDIFQEHITQLQTYHIQADYNAIGEHLYVIPFSTNYQYTKISEEINEPIVLDNSFLHNYLNVNQITFTTEVIRYTLDTDEPYIPLKIASDSEFPLQLRYLQHLHDDEDIKILNTYFKDFDSNLLISKNAEQLKSHTLEGPSYINSLYNFGIEKKDNEELEHIGLIKNLQDTFNTFLNSDALIKKHIAIAAYLRSIHFIARTMVGIDEKELELISSPATDNLISWVEILSTNHEWIPLATSNTSLMRESSLALFEYERYYKKTLELIYPIIPRITLTKPTQGSK